MYFIMSRAVLLLIAMYTLLWYWRLAFVMGLVLGLDLLILIMGVLPGWALGFACLLCIAGGTLTGLAIGGGKDRPPIWVLPTTAAGLQLALSWSTIIALTLSPPPWNPGLRMFAVGIFTSISTALGLLLGLTPGYLWARRQEKRSGFVRDI